MNFLDLYQLIERGKYGEYKEKKREISLSEEESIFLETSYLIRINGKDSFSELSSVIMKGNTKIQNQKQLIVQIKNLGFLIFEGREGKINSIIGQADKLFHQKVSINDNFPDGRVLSLIQSDFYHYLAIYNMMNGEYGESEQWFIKAIDLEESNKIPMRIGKMKNNYALLKIDQGDLVKAQSLNFEVKTLWDMTNSYHNLGQLYGNISEIYEIRGIFESAIYYARKAEEILDDVGNNYENILIKGSILRILRKSQFNLDLDPDALFSSILDKISSNKELLENQLISRILLELSVYTAIKDPHKEDQIFSLFKEMLKVTNDSVYVKYRFKLSQAIYHTYQGRFADKIDAQRNFKSIIESEDTDFLVQVLATQYLIDLLLFEFQTTRDRRVLKELRDYQIDLENWAKTNNSIDLQLKADIISMQLLAYSDKGEELLSQLAMTMVMSIENGLQVYTDFLQVVAGQIKKKLQHGQSIVEWDIVNSITAIDSKSSVLEDLHIHEVFLLDRFNEVHPLLDTDIVSNSELLIGELQQISSKYYSTSTIKQNLIINKFGSFPWLGIVFEGNFQEAVNVLDFLANAMTLTMIYDSSSVDSELDDFSMLGQILSELLASDDYRDYFEIDDDQAIRSEFSKLKNYKLLLHPMRLSIMDVLIKQFSIPRKTLERIIEGNRGTFASHLTKLIDNDLLQSENQFINNEPLMVIYVTNNGIQYYEEFKEIMKHV